MEQGIIDYWNAIQAQHKLDRAHGKQTLRIQMEDLENLRKSHLNKIIQYSVDHGMCWFDIPPGAVLNGMVTNLRVKPDCK